LVPCVCLPTSTTNVATIEARTPKKAKDTSSEAAPLYDKAISSPPNVEIYTRHRPRVRYARYCRVPNPRCDNPLPHRHFNHLVVYYGYSGAHKWVTKTPVHVVVLGLRDRLCGDEKYRIVPRTRVDNDEYLNGSGCGSIQRSRSSMVFHRHLEGPVPSGNVPAHQYCPPGLVPQIVQDGLDTRKKHHD
jgi:hypothetical protein